MVRDKLASLTIADIVRTVLGSAIIGAIVLYGSVKVIETRMDGIQARADAAYTLAYDVAMRQGIAIAERKTTDNHHNEILMKIEGRLDRIEDQHARMLGRKW